MNSPRKMRTRFALTIILVIGLSGTANAELPDFYVNWSESFGANTDSNMGLTVFPVLLIPSGGRNEGMGTAYTAVAEGPELLESNPAGSVYASGSEIGLVHHDWISDSKLLRLSILCSTSFPSNCLSALRSFALRA